MVVGRGGAGRGVGGHFCIRGRGRGALAIGDWAGDVLACVSVPVRTSVLPLRIRASARAVHARAGVWAGRAGPEGGIEEVVVDGGCIAEVAEAVRVEGRLVRYLQQCSYQQLASQQLASQHLSSLRLQTTRSVSARKRDGSLAPMLKC